MTGVTARRVGRGTPGKIDEVPRELYDRVMGDGDPILFARNLRVRYERRGRVTEAVRGVDLEVARGESLGIIGESGCGKSSLAKALLGLVPTLADELALFGTPVLGLSRADWKPLRRRAQIVFQDVGGSLSPRMRIGDAVTEPLVVHGIVGSGEERRRSAASQLAAVGLDAGLARRFPHELSGGQRQRALIARALATSPELIVADEPIASLDISVQTQILRLLDDIRRARALTMVFITHDIRAVRSLCSRVAVMYAGRVVEEGATDAILRAPAHPYTHLLVSSAPALDAESNIPLITDGEVGRIPETGCAFAPRCPNARSDCRDNAPFWIDREGGRARCRYPLASATGVGAESAVEP